MIHKVYIVIISAFLICSNVNSQSLIDNSLKLKEIKQLGNSYEKNTLWIKTKSSFLAGTLSFIVPGAALGQFYNEEYINGAVRVGISAICIGWFLASPSVDAGGGGSGDQKIIAGLLYAVNWIASVIDASVSASKINRHNSFSSDKLKLFFNLCNNKLNLSVFF